MIPVSGIITARQAPVLGAATHAGAKGNNSPLRVGLDKVAEIQKPLQFAWKDQIQIKCWISKSLVVQVRGLASSQQPVRGSAGGQEDLSTADTGSYYPMWDPVPNL